MEHHEPSLREVELQKQLQKKDLRINSLEEQLRSTSEKQAQQEIKYRNACEEREELRFKVSNLERQVISLKHEKENLKSSKGSQEKTLENLLATYEDQIIKYKEQLQMQEEKIKKQEDQLNSSWRQIEDVEETVSKDKEKLDKKKVCKSLLLEKLNDFESQATTITPENTHPGEGIALTKSELEESFKRYLQESFKKIFERLGKMEQQFSSFEEKLHIFYDFYLEKESDVMQANQLKPVIPNNDIKKLKNIKEEKLCESLLLGKLKDFESQAMNITSENSHPGEGIALTKSELEDTFLRPLQESFNKMFERLGKMELQFSSFEEKLCFFNDFLLKKESDVQQANQLKQEEKLCMSLLLEKLRDFESQAMSIKPGNAHPGGGIALTKSELEESFLRPLQESFNKMFERQGKMEQQFSSFEEKLHLSSEFHLEKKSDVQKANELKPVTPSHDLKKTKNTKRTVKEDRSRENISIATPQKRTIKQEKSEENISNATPQKRAAKRGKSKENISNAALQMRTVKEDRSKENISNAIPQKRTIKQEKSEENISNATPQKRTVLREKSEDNTNSSEPPQKENLLKKIKKGPLRLELPSCNNTTTVSPGGARGNENIANKEVQQKRTLRSRKKL